jgi:type II secretory pathway component GspD/PulD (secretin)
MGQGGGLLWTLRSDEVQAELDLNDEQLQQVEELSEQSQSRAGGGDLFQRMGEARSEEERAALREEMQRAFQERQRQIDEQLKSILNAQQMARLQQISLQRRGMTALADEEIADSLGLNEEQKSQIEELQDERRDAARELGFRASQEDRETFAAEWDAKIAAVLTPAQQQSWKERLGPPLGEGAAQASQAAASPAAPATQPPRRAAFEPPVPEGAEVIASFTPAGGNAPPRADQPAPSSSAADDEIIVSFNFEHAPWEMVLHRFAEITGLTADLRDVPPGTFTHKSQNQYTVTEALDVINSYLLRRGYVVVKGEGFMVSLNVDEEIPPNLVPTIDASELYDRGRFELLTVVFPLPGVDVSEVAPEVEKLKGPQGTVVGMTVTNSLIVTDIGQNLRRIQKLIANMAPGSEDMVFRPYPLEHISADEAELLVKQMLGVSTGVTNVSSSSSRDSSRDRDSRSRWGFGDSRSRGDSDRDSRTVAAAVNLSRARIVADPRTNRLLATASPSEHRIIEEAVKTIDIEATGSFLSTKPYLFTYEVMTADSREVTRTIDVLMPGIVVNEDGRNDLIHILATPELHERVRDLIQRLDGAGGGSQVAVIPLSRMDPSLAVATLQGMFIADDEDAPTIQPDLIGRQVMVRGTETQIVQVRRLLADLGEDGTGSARSGGGPVRTFNLSSRDPAEVLPILEQMWRTRTGSRIRIVNPPSEFRGGPRVLNGRPAAEDDAPAEPEPPAAREAQGEDEDRLGVQRDVDGELFPVSPFAVSVESEPVADANGSSDAADTAGPQATEPAKPQAEDAAGDALTAVEEPVSPVTVRVTGGELMLISQDEAALDELEFMLEDVLQAVPPRTTWTVVPLRAADATETAAMIEQLFPDSSVSQVSSSSSGFLGMMSGGLTSFGRSVGDMTGLSSLGTGPQTLRIIPDVRLNSLFISGPTYRVDEVLDMLEVLDASGLSESLRDRMPQMIPVRYADVAEVFEIVKSVYEPELQPADNGRGNPAAGFAAMFGGSRRGRGDDDENGGNGEPQVTLGIDRNTSNLIVSASAATFEEIRLLVEQVDEAARAARRTVTVYSLQNTNAAAMRDSLSSLMPKVTVSTTSGGSTRSSSSSSRSSGSDSSDSDDVRRRMEFWRQMRERSGSGGDSSGDRGDRSSRDRDGSSFGGRGFGGGGFPFGSGFGGFGGFGRRGGDDGDNDGRSRGGRGR